MNKGMSRQGTKDEKAMSNVGKSLTKEDDKEKMRKLNICYRMLGKEGCEKENYFLLRDLELSRRFYFSVGVQAQEDDSGGRSVSC